jgi:hypothetical protein
VVVGQVIINHFFIIEMAPEYLFSGYFLKSFRNNLM